MPAANASLTVEATTFELLHRICQRDPRQVILRCRERGLWRDVRATDVAGRVAQLVGEFRTFGIDSGTPVLVGLDVGLDWICCDLALEAVGAQAVHPGTTDGSDAADVSVVLVGVGHDPRAFQRVHGRAHLHLLPPTDGGSAELPSLALAGGTRQFASALGGDAARLASVELVRRWTPFVAPTSSRGADRTLAQSPRPGVLDWASIVLAPLQSGAIAHLPDWSESTDDAFHAVEPTLVLSTTQEWTSVADAVDTALAATGWLKRASFRAACALLPVDALTTRVLRSRVGLAATRRGLAYGPIDESSAMRWQSWRLPIEPIEPIAGSSALGDVPDTAISDGGRSSRTCTIDDSESHDADHAMKQDAR